MKRIKLYDDLAEWWPLLSDPRDYAEEAEIYRKTIKANLHGPSRTMLELGSGGGNNAFHLKNHFEMTLVDLSRQMLRVSRRLNPECKHIEGDMRSFRLNSVFDVVFIHDAISYMATRKELVQAIRTAFEHCRPGGLALFVPDYTKESFEPSTSHGGHDSASKGLRYLDWTIDDDPGDETYRSYMVYLLRHGKNIQRSDVDEHVLGLFSESVWVKTIGATGFKPLRLPYKHSEFTNQRFSLFVGIKPPAAKQS